MLIILFVFFAVLNVVVSPSISLALLESSVTFRCSAYSNQQNPSLIYSWEYPTQADANVVIKGNLLTIESVSQESQGIYRCTVKENNMELTSSSFASLTIGNKPDYFLCKFT